ncbi:MAG: alpha/beta hydrolase [Chitinophagaceae bacterium]|nr:alpha/beta hydrolase [Chitinophagaceae bacterium]
MFRKTWFRAMIAILAILFIIYLLGPHPEKPVYTGTMPEVPREAAALENYVRSNEAKHVIKPNNEARIVWFNDSLKNKTAYSVVYLHGFSASQEEGRPVHTNIAKEFGCNLYLARLAEHGLDTTNPLQNLTATAYWESSKAALAIGKQLGDKVILMGTSTGGTNALQLAAAYPNDVSALILLSPNVAIFNDKSWLLNNHWGLQIAEWITGDEYVTSADTRPVYKQYWYSRYPLVAATQLQEYIETTMTTETFKKVEQPVLMLYYYKDDIHQDSVVSIPAMLKMFDELGTPASKKVKAAMPNAQNHVLGSYIRSKDLLGVQKEIERFLEKQLHLIKTDQSVTNTGASAIISITGSDR